MVEQKIGTILHMLDQMPNSLNPVVDEKTMVKWKTRLDSRQPILTGNEFPVVEAASYLAALIREKKGYSTAKGEVEQLILQYLSDQTTDTQWQKYSLDKNQGEAWAHLACQTALARMANIVRQYVPLQDWQECSCPVCGTAPAFATLEGDGGQRKLICGACFTRWRYKRIGCAFCSEEQPENLKVLTVEEFPGWSVAVCLSCQSYIKTVDLRQMMSAPRWQQAVITTLSLDYAVNRWLEALWHNAKDLDSHTELPRPH